MENSLKPQKEHWLKTAMENSKTKFPKANDLPKIILCVVSCQSGLSNYHNSMVISPEFWILDLFTVKFIHEKACWNCDFRASRWTKMSKFSGSLPLDPVGGAYSAPPNLPAVLLPRFARSLSATPLLLSVFFYIFHSCLKEVREKGLWVREKVREKSGKMVLEFWQTPCSGLAKIGSKVCKLVQK